MITVKAKRTPFNLAIFGLGFFKYGSNALVSLPISTVGCSLNAVFSGQFGDGSPKSRSKAIANTRIETAINTAIMRITSTEIVTLLRSGKFICIDYARAFSVLLCSRETITPL
jgi:hypothetical protein